MLFTFRRIIAAFLARTGGWIPDSIYLKCRYRLLMGQKLNLDNPKTYNEKLNWLKIYYRPPFYKHLVDKSTVKDYVKSIIGDSYIIPTYCIWNSVNDINLEKLPKQFVLKSTNGAGNSGVVICKDKMSLDLPQAKAKLKKSLKTNWKIMREWVYKDVQPRLIAEELIGEGKPLTDYKFFCFDGKVKMILVVNGRGEKQTMDFYDDYFVRLPLRRPHFPNSIIENEKPENLDTMVKIAEKLSNNMPHVRVDLYNTKGKIYFGELTFFSAGGMEHFEPEVWDYKIGSWLTLPNKLLQEQ